MDEDESKFFEKVMDIGKNLSEIAQESKLPAKTYITISVDDTGFVYISALGKQMTRYDDKWSVFADGREQNAD